MQITVKLFARASQLAGASEVLVEINEGARVADFRKALKIQHPSLKPVIESLFIALDAEYADDGQIIHAATEVACFPPVSGG